MSQSAQNSSPTVSAALPQDTAPPAVDRKSASDDAVAALALASTVDPNCPDLKPPKIDRSVLRLDGDTLKDEQLIVSC